MLSGAESAGTSTAVTRLVAPPARQARRPVRWMHNALLDLVVACAWVPFAVACHLLEGDGPALRTVIGATFLLSFSHQPLTLALVYGDPEQFRLRKAVFTWSPIVFVVVLLVVVQVDLVLLAVVAGLWNAEHTLMQRYGITRIYGRKAGQVDGGLEKAMLFSWLALGLIWVAADPATPARVDHIGMAGSNRTAVGVLTDFRSVAHDLVGVAVIAVVVIAAVWVVAEWRRGAEANPAKWVYVGSTAALFGVILLDPIAGLMGYVGAHAIEYFVIVHQSLGRRYGEGLASDQPVLGRAVRGRSGRLGFLVAYLVVVVVLATALKQVDSVTIYLVVFFALGGLHVFYDGFIWKLRRPEVAESLAIPARHPA